MLVLYGDNGIVGVKFAVSLFVRLLNSADAFNAVLCKNVVNVYDGGVSNKADNVLVRALNVVGAYALGFEPKERYL